VNKLLPYILLTVVMLGGTACGGPRKACRSAEGLLAKAVQKCPDLLKAHVEHDTVQVLIPGHGASGETGYTAADMDSVVAMCNDLLNRALAEENNRAQLRNATANTERVVDRMRVQLCDLEPVTHADSLIQLKMWTANGKLQYWYRVLPRIVDVGVTTTVPQVVAKDCPPPGVAHWYRTALWWTWGLMLAAMIIFGWIIRRDTRRWRAGLIPKP
jgi:hypothetical protein